MGIIKKFSMREQCYDIIKRKILRQEYNLGEDINIAQLSSELSVSNTPIREALSQLEADGLVITSLNAKPQVVSLTTASFRDISHTVYVLVVGAYELCVREERIDKCLRMMKKSIDAQDNLLAKGDYYRFIEETVYFDQIIFEALENSNLLSMFNRLSNILFLMYRTNHQRDDWDHSRSISEHRRICEAIESGNHQEVEELLFWHYEQTYDER